ncbi:uncharacterized protein [Amphiura filiformis]|uniref:uncharacterized protein isoform X2 n=1 Tax=Amphiura filiformis TaxID=82378 RepID=UPI003B2167BE
MDRTLFILICFVLLSGSHAVFDDQCETADQVPVNSDDPRCASPTRLCPDGEVLCSDGLQCIDETEWCDTDDTVAVCTDLSDEQNGSCTATCINCPNVTVTPDPNMACQPVSWAPPSNISSEIIVYEDCLHFPHTTFSPGRTTTVTYTFETPEGFKNYCKFEVEVPSEMTCVPPVDNCPNENILVTADNPANDAIVTYGPISSSDPGATVELISGSPSDSKFPYGYTRIAYKISTDTDESWCIFYIHVKDVNECSSNPCTNGGVCRDGVNSYVCECPSDLNGYPLWMGQFCEIDVDECASNPCANGGTCIDKEGVSLWTCVCKPGWIGVRCTDGFNACASHPCLNGGTCFVGFNAYICLCASGYEGSLCEIDINECHSNPCMNSGNCDDNVNGYECQCRPAWTGTHCDIEYGKECESTPCLNNGICNNAEGRFTCTCPEGLTGLICGTDVNECDNFPCLNEGTCSNTRGSYTCNCRVGWTGFNCEVDIDECATQQCQNGGNCVDALNSYQCKCLPGYEGLNCERDINECASIPCQNSGVCRNLQNRYTCSCQDGYAGFNCEEKLCPDGLCLNGGFCEPNATTLQCRCPPEWTGTQCQAFAEQRPNEPATVNQPVIIGITIAVFALIVIVIIVVVVVRRRFKRQMTPDEDIALDTTHHYEKKITDVTGGVLCNDALYNVDETIYTTATDYGNLNEDFVFPREKLHIVKELGSGQFGCVLLAEADGVKMAVKTLKENASLIEKNNLLKELQVLKILKHHPNVLGLVGCCIEKEPYYVIVEFMANRDLKSFLISSRATYEYAHTTEQEIRSTLSAVQLILFAKQVADGMAHIAANQCIHRDLAARNILVGEDLVCKVADFGLARDVMNVRIYERTSDAPLPIRWMAIESLVDDIFTIESDVWSFGVVIWEIISLGARPYPGIGSKSLIQQLRRGYRMPCPKYCSQQLYDIILATWNSNPSMRPTFEELSSRLDMIIETESDYLALDINDLIYDDVAGPEVDEKF